MKNYTLEVRTIQQDEAKMNIFYQGWIISVLNKKFHRMFLSLYYTHPPLSKINQHIQLQHSIVIFHHKLLVNQWNDPLSSWCESVFNQFFVPSWIGSCFSLNRVKKSVFPPQISWSLKLWFDEWPLERIFINEFTFCLKKQHVSDCQKEISFVQIMHLKLTFLIPDNIKSYYSQSIAR